MVRRNVCMGAMVLTGVVMLLLLSGCSEAPSAGSSSLAAEAPPASPTPPPARPASTESAPPVEARNNPDPPPAPTPAKLIRVIAVGDTMVGHVARKLLKKEGYDYPFRHVKPLLKGADLVIANLESPITERTDVRNPDKPFSYRMDNKAAAALQRCGINWVNLANNHSMDYHVGGLSDTVRALKSVGIGQIGAGKDLKQATKGARITIGDVRIGLLGFNEERAYEKKGADSPFATKSRAGLAPASEKEIFNAILRLRPKVDVLMVSCHWGRNYKPIMHEQLDLGRRMIDWGADIVLGHGSHLAQGIEVRKGKAIVYSLGNFVFSTLGRFEDASQKEHFGWVADVGIEGKRIVELTLTPITADNLNKRTNFQPKPATEEDLRQLLKTTNKVFRTEFRVEGNQAVLDLRTKGE